MTPIGKLILAYVGTTPLRRWTLVCRLGYLNVDEGLRHLDVLMETGIAPVQLLTRLAPALKVDHSVVSAALAETSEQLWHERVQARSGDQEHARRHFKPHVFVETERSTSKVGRLYLVAVDGLRRLKQLPVAETVVCTPAEWQHRYVASLIRQHQVVTSGWCGPFGRVMGYTYHPEYGRTIPYSLSGQQLVPSGAQVSTAGVS